MSDPHGILEHMALTTDADKALLDFAGRWYRYPKHPRQAMLRRARPDRRGATGAEDRRPHRSPRGAGLRPRRRP